MIIDNLGPVIGSNSMFSTVLHGSGIKVAHMNAQSIVPSPSSTKFDEVRNLFENSIIDVIGVSETWFNPTVTDRAVHIQGYKIHRKDRVVRRAGGVCLYISERFKTRVIYDTMTESVCESLYVEVTLGNGQLILIGVVYLPHRSFNVCESDICDIASSYENVIIMGDFNVDVFSRGDEVRNLCGLSSLSVVHNSQPTHYCNDRHSTSLIDYFLVSDIGKVDCKGQFQLPALNSNHAVICMSYEIQTTSETEDIFYRDFRSLNLGQCISQIHSIDFSPIYGNSHPDVQVSFFNSTLLGLFHDNVPLRKVNKRNFNDWMNHHEIRAAINNRNLAFRAMRENRSEDTIRMYCTHRNRVKSVIRRIRRRSSINFFSNCDQKQIWQRLRSIGAVGGDQTSFVIDPDEFNEYSRMPPISAPTISLDQDLFENSTGFVFRNINDHHVFNAMSRLKSNSVGADGIPLKFLKAIFSEIVPHLTYIFNTCISRSIFPSDWKVGRIVPIPKVKSPSSVNDYRPITILPCCSKIFEIILKDQLQSYLDEARIISPFQSGFRKGYNTSTLMLDIVESIRTQLDKHLVSVLIFLDFRKAFDSISHDLLARKLVEQYNFSSTSSRLLLSYLSNRSQFVKVGVQYSNLVNLYRGVPQGSILGPLLFLLYINDIFRNFTFLKCYTYADDIQLLGSSECRNIALFERRINSDLFNVFEWSRQNFLDLNPEKCKMMIFSGNDDYRIDVFLNNVRIERVDVYKSLGFYIDKKLSFERHINSVVSKVSWTLRKLYNMSTYLPLAIRRRVGMALCYPLFLYGLEMYSCTTQDYVNTLKLCFNRVIRYIFNLKIRDHVSGFRIQLLGYDFGDFISSRQIILFFKIMKYNCPSYLAERFVFGNSERTNLIVYPSHSTLIMQKSFVMKVGRLWNDVIPYSDRTFQQTVSQFSNIFRTNL